MKAISLQSGSNGNSIYVEANGVRLLFDAGISGCQAATRLAARGRDITSVDALVISHGSLIEVGLVACFPHGDHAAWGPPFDKCEGARLTYQDGAWVALELLRVNGQLVAATIDQTNLPGRPSRLDPV